MDDYLLEIIKARIQLACIRYELAHEYPWILEFDEYV